MATKTRPRCTLAPGTYLTDGARLVEVRKTIADGEVVIVEEGPPDAPDISTISAGAVADRWRVVEKAADG